MICKYCGEKLRIEKEFCQKCGKKVQRTLFECGNGFWDIAEMKTTVRVTPPSVTPIRVIETTKAVPARKSVMICAALCVVSILCLLAAVFVSLSAGVSIKRLEKNLNAHIISENSTDITETIATYEQIILTPTPTLKVEDTPAIDYFSAEQESNQKSAAPVSTEIPTASVDPMSDVGDLDTSNYNGEAIIDQGNPETENLWQRWSPWQKKDD